MNRYHPQSASFRLKKVMPNEIVQNNMTRQRRIPQVLGPNAVNTHFFDGKLSEPIDLIKDDIHHIIDLSNSEKQMAFWRLKSHLSILDSPLQLTVPLRCLDSIINSHKIYGRIKKGNNNYDPINDLFACDLLYLLYLKICRNNNKEEVQEYSKLLLSNLEEMATGLCPQGRTTRLLQILVMLKT